MATNLTTIDILGSAEQLVKAVAAQILIVLAVVVLALTAPFLYTVGAMWLALRYAEYAPTWAVIYLIFGPIACACWMIFIELGAAFIAGWAGKVYRDDGGNLISTWWMCKKGGGHVISGFFGSLLAEGVFTYAAHVYNVIPNHLILYFSVAPFFVFAPCWMLVLSRWTRRNRTSGTF